MDYEDIIKLQEESPIYSTGNHSENFKECMASFYDHDSELYRKDPYQSVIDSELLSIDQVMLYLCQAIDYVQDFIDIIDAPLQEIMNCCERVNCSQDLDKILLKKKILKRKNFLKRFRAKNRQPKVISQVEQYPLINNGPVNESEAQIKKKRNRVSAQISRDRKKQYFKDLEVKNIKLQEEIIRAKLQNEKLKRQIAQSDKKPKNKHFAEAFNNKLTRLLVFLGIICLIGMLKDTVSSAGQNLSKFNKNSQKAFSLNQFASTEQQSSMIEQGRQKVAEFLKEEELDLQQAQSDDSTIISTKQRNSQESPNSGNVVKEQLIAKLSSMKQELCNYGSL